MALDGLAGRAEEGVPDLNPLAPKSPPFTPKANSVIFLFMAGAPSQIDLFDPKPKMKKWDGQTLPESMTKDQQFALSSRRPPSGPAHVTCPR